jgi:hypothetical protein
MVLYFFTAKTFGLLESSQRDNSKNYVLLLFTFGSESEVFILVVLPLALNARNPGTIAYKGTPAPRNIPQDGDPVFDHGHLPFIQPSITRAPLTVLHVHRS